MLESNKKTLKNVLLAAAVLFVLLWLFKGTGSTNNVFQMIKNVLSPFISGAAIAFVFNVPMRAIENQLKGVKRLKLRRTFAILLTLVAFLLILAVVCLLLIPQLAKTIDSLIPSLQNFAGNMSTNTKEFLAKNPDIEQWIINNTDMEKLDWASLLQQGASVLGNRFSSIIAGAVSAIGSVTNALVNVVIALVFAVYSLYQKENLARQGRRLLYSFLSEKNADYIVHIFRLSNSTFSNFLSGQCVEVCILGSMFAIVMAIFRMPYIPLVSVLVAVTAFIPVVGSFIGCFVGAFLIMVNDPIQAIWFIAMFLVIQQIENNLIYPRVVGSSIGLPGMWVLFSVAVGARLMGIAGMFLMIPVASVVYTLLRDYANNRLGETDIPAEKLTPQSPDLRSPFRERLKFNRKKRKNSQNDKK